MISHAGAVPGFSSEVSFLPAVGVGLVALANGDGGNHALLDIRKRVYKDILGLQGSADFTVKYVNSSVVKLIPDRRNPVPVSSWKTKRQMLTALEPLRSPQSLWQDTQAHTIVRDTEPSHFVPRQATLRTALLLNLILPLWAWTRRLSYWLHGPACGPRI